MERFIKMLVKLKKLMGIKVPRKKSHAVDLQVSTSAFDIGQMSAALATYFEPIKSIPGWFNVDDFGHFSLVLKMQTLSGLQGDLLEIGSYHGRSTAAMAVHLAGSENVVVCDAFDLLIDDTYTGNFSIPRPGDLIENVLKVNPSLNSDRIVIHKCLSSDLKLNTEQLFRFIHLDGGHTAEQAYSDLALAHLHVMTGGVIVIDDYHSPVWPTVTEGTDAYLKNCTDLKVLADLNRHGANGRKLYLIKTVS